MLQNIFGSKKKVPVEIPAPDSPLFAGIQWDRLPRHVAIIMDGNGRWAKAQGMLRSAGHSAGVSTLKNVLRAALGLKIEAITVYAFSTENWKRPAQEVDFLMKLFFDSMKREMAELDQDNVRIKFIGRINELSETLQKQIREAEELMQDNDGIHFNVAINYGGQDELVRAAQSLAAKAAAGELAPGDINAAMLESELDTCGEPPVDLVIRTSGDMRLSNYLLWQSAYAELYFTETNWPDFTQECFVEAMKDFASRERRFGGLKDKK